MIHILKGPDSRPCGHTLQETGKQCRLHTSAVTAHLAGAPLVDALLVGAHRAWHGLLALRTWTRHEQVSTAVLSRLALFAAPANMLCSILVCKMLAGKTHDSCASHLGFRNNHSQLMELPGWDENSPCKSSQHVQSSQPHSWTLPAQSQGCLGTLQGRTATQQNMLRVEGMLHLHSA
jgi:hypothetical protein